MRYSLVVLGFLALGGVFFASSAVGQGRVTATPERSTSLVHANALVREDNRDAEQTARLDVVDQKDVAFAACGDAGRLWGPGHVLSDGNGCITALTIGADGRVLLTGGLQIGTGNTCDPTRAGALRMPPSGGAPEYCDGTTWRISW